MTRAKRRRGLGSGSTSRLHAMRSTSLFLLLTFGCLALFAAPAWSGGVGGSFSYGDGDGDVDDTDDFFPDLDTSADYFEVGFTYDSNLAADRLFNYRMSLNLQLVEQELSLGPISADIDGTGFSLNQLFGFGLIRTKNVRVFVGPTIHLGVTIFDDEQAGVDIEEVLVVAAIGPEVGVNLHLGRRLTMSLTGYYRYGLQVQAFDSPISGTNQSDGVFTGDEHRVGLTTAIYFRFGNDQFRPGTTR
jgi:hypothetical protein